MYRSVRLHAAAAVSTALLLMGCAGPSFSYRDYERKAAHTADEAASVVQTAILTVEAAEGRRAPGGYLDVLLTEAETTLGDVQSTFESVQPPVPAADQLRAEVGETLAEAGEVLAALRITVRRGHLAELPQLAEPLTGIHEELVAFAEEHR
jgi:hypothetical protein